jgi:hypothetical protein
LPTSLYIYYRVARPAEARAAVREIQTRLGAETGIRGKLLQKLDEPALWMEIYEQISDVASFETRLAMLLDETKFGSLLKPGSRRTVERFAEACA